ncbi:semaphorin-5A isoform X2 [Rhopalosiphum padi]|uniref:semaphorin-5A isoform X2 n=1 Tax=Rhopalosiphum padi TaxID=40932 RepID=UPI00298E070B|nr:semaphorin-5A isoform X2 [Rhopalosiphum padi]
MMFLIFLVVACVNGHQNEPGHHVIPYKDVMSTANTFSEDGVTSYSQLLFDIARKQVVVGARDNIYRLDLDDLKKIEAARWPAAEEKVQLCLVKGQSVDDCHNYVKVLLSTGKRLFACGTGAFSPQCTWREMENANSVTDTVRGVGKCPYSPLSNITAMITLNGQYFAGSPMDFSGADSAIVRDLGASYLRTKNYDAKWLNEPQFVGSFETDAYVYFLFRESAVEYINCGKRVYSRIARMCKNDVGGQTMLRDNWTTFIKARLNCSLPGDYPFYFDEIQGMTYLPDEGLVYATFTTPSNGIAGSAVCSFNLTAINAAFNGPFKHQASVGSEWVRYNPPHQLNHGHCQRQDPNQILDSSRYQLMDNAVQPTTMDPLYYKPLEILTHIAVDVVPTKPHGSLKVLYVATTEGTVKKITILPKSSVTCTLEEWNIFPEGSGSQIMALHYLKVTDSIYVGTRDRVLKIPAQHCGRHRSKEACMNAMDPYCGWNEHVDKCQPPTNGNIMEHNWRQDVTKCPDRSRPIDGGWSSWSTWTACTQNVNGKESTDQCLCSSRTCTNPEPKYNGADCQGPTIQVTNCTVHGQWSGWSDWSACTQSCGSAVKVRKRTCGNPAPAFGGRVCVGRDTDEMFCHSNPPCPVSPPVVKEPGWSAWGAWGKCSAKCGGGIRQRSRYCNNPPPQEGQDCIGCSEEYELCNQKPCTDSIKKISAWSPWVSAGNGTHKRYRFSCRTQPDISALSIMQDKEENRLCQDGSCHRLDQPSDSEDSWSEWSPWSACSADCGGGVQVRTRTCEGPLDNCEGQNTQTRPCNTQECKGEWSCWTDFNECSVTCGEGVRTRSRKCIQKGTSTEGCDGPYESQEPCYVPCHDMDLGWEDWSEWSVCDKDNLKHRTRKCTFDHCLGPDIESIPCFEKNGVVSSSGSTLLVCLLSFLTGALVAGAAFCAWQRRRKPKLPSSPHYITTKQNPYVTVPMKEYRAPAKRTPSFTKPTTVGAQHHGNGTAATGTLPRLFNKPADYETATIKRNSHSLVNGHTMRNRPDLEQEKFF